MLDTSFIESFSQFIHGVSTAFFIYFGLGFVTYRAKNRPMRILGYLFCGWAIANFKNVFLYFETLDASIYWRTLFMSIDMWLIPLCALFLLEILSPGYASRRRIILLEIPFLLLSACYAITELQSLFFFSLIYVAIFCAAIAVFVAVRFCRYNRYIRNNYSYTEYINVYWVGNTIVVWLLCLAVWLYNGISDRLWDDLFFYSSSTVLCIFILYYSLRQEWVDSVSDEDEEPLAIDNAMAVGDKGVKSGISLSELYKLEECIRERQLFLNPKLSLADLAVEIGTNRSYLSNYLNNELGITFYDYINSFRLERARVLLSSPDFSGSLEEVAIHSGFNSLSTFRRSFQKKYGCTPLQYRKTCGDI